MKKIVFILGSYYPYYSAVGRCMGNIIEELDKENEVVVVCLRTKKGQLSHEKYLDHQIIRTETKAMLKRRLITDSINNANGIIKYYNIFILNIFRIVSFFKIIFSKDTIDKQLVNVYFEELKKNKDIDVIVAASSPFESIVASLKYKKVKKNVKIVPILFDLFSLNSSLNRLEINKVLKLKNNMMIEEEMLKESEKALYVSSWKKHLETNFNRYSEKLVLIEHPLVKKISDCMCLSNFDKNKINISFTGVVDKKVRCPIFTLKLLSEVIKNNNNIVMHFFIRGNAIEYIDTYSKKFPGQIINHGEVESDVARSAIINSEILLSIGNSEVVQIPSKIFEYMSSCKPIIHTYVTKNDPVIEILNEYPLSLCLSQNDMDIKESVKKIEEFIKKTQHTELQFSNIEKIYFNAVPRYTANIIQNI